MQPLYGRQKPTNSQRRRMHEAMAYQKAIYDEHSADDRRHYAELAAEYRARHGLVDGLKTDQKGFHDYMAKREAEDAVRRPGNRTQARRRRTYGQAGECRVVKPAGPQRLAVTYEARKEEG